MPCAPLACATSRPAYGAPVAASPSTRPGSTSSGTVSSTRSASSSTLGGIGQPRRRESCPAPARLDGSETAAAAVTWCPARCQRPRERDPARPGPITPTRSRAGCSLVPVSTSTGQPPLPWPTPDKDSPPAGRIRFPGDPERPLFRCPCRTFRQLGPVSHNLVGCQAHQDASNDPRSLARRNWPHMGQWSKGDGRGGGRARRRGPGPGSSGRGSSTRGTAPPRAAPGTRRTTGSRDQVGARGRRVQHPRQVDHEAGADPGEQRRGLRAGLGERDHPRDEQRRGRPRLAGPGCGRAGRGRSRPPRPPRSAGRARPVQVSGGRLA